ncbi:hypothetical protein KC678_00135 [Candidatus Dojkabacteria bacterium]|uniref:Lamin tail domain-containing protein n=1 Tax=Candidatus Dojkabacteria bacterium TaxID=2099670 RepID=A0A955L077_9BACT|nr:hypothetical protein [Candidatus Dojkabacteria bacterium]
MINPKGDDRGKEWIKVTNLDSSTLNTEDVYIYSEGRSEDISNYCPIIQSEEACIIEFQDLFLHNDFGEINLMYDGEVLDEFIYNKEIADNTLIEHISEDWLITNLDDTSLDEQEVDNNFELIFTEIYPSPNAGEVEWLKIYNNLSEDSPLKTITIHRDSCDSDLVTKFTDEIIIANSYYQISDSMLKKNLLNAGGTLVLCDEEIELDKVTYPEIKKGESYYLESGIWKNSGDTTSEENIEANQTSTIKTKEESNIVSTPTTNTNTQQTKLITSSSNIVQPQVLSVNTKEQVDIKYALPNLQKQDLSLADNQPIKLNSGFYINQNLWIILLLISLTILSTLIINNKEFLLYFYQKIKTAIKNYERPVEYFRR